MGQFKVIILGSGLAGNLLANGLINNNIDVEVYERLASDAKREGYQIRLGENALMGFRACLTAEQKRSIIEKFGRASGSLSSAPIIYDRNFRPLLDLNKFPNYEKSAPISRKILRDLLAAPVEQAGKVYYSKGYESYKVINAGTSDERIRVLFEDGSERDCDILVAADGSHSKVNNQIGLDNIVPVDSHWSFLAKSDLPTERYLQMSQELLRSPIGVSSSRRGMYYCAYLPDNDKRQHRQPDSKRSARFDDSISSCFFAYGIPVDECPADAKTWSNEKQWELIQKDMQDHWCSKYQEIVSLLRGSDVYCFQGRASTRPPADWRQKIRSPAVPERGHPRVLVMGDAMHAMMPNRGMGGNQAMRDCVSLLAALQGLSRTSTTRRLIAEDIEHACKVYEDEMMPRAFDWVEKSAGTTVFSVDSDTWTGYLTTLAIGWGLGVAYYVGRLFNAFNKSDQHVNEAPEFDE